MRYIKIGFLFVCCGSVAAWLGAYAAQMANRSRVNATNTSSQKQQIISVPAQYTSFGEVWESSRFEWQIQAHNHSSHKAAITVHSTCHCTAIKPDHFIIEAGQMQSITLTFDLHTEFAPGETSRAFSTNVLFDVSSADASTPLNKRERVAISGVVKRPIDIQNSIYVGNISDLTGQTGKPLLMPFRLPLVPKKLTAISLSPLLDASIVRSEEQAGQLVVAWKSLPPRGTYKGQVVLKLESDGVNDIPNTIVDVTANVVNDIQTEPGRIIDICRPRGGLHEASFSLHSLTGQSIQIESVQAEGEGLQIVKWDPKGAIIDIRQSIAKLGQQATAVCVRATSGRHPYTLRIPVIYYGVEP